MKLKKVGLNETELELGEKTVLVSYSTPVACHISGEGFFKTDTKWSVTTSKHITRFLNRHGGSKFEVMPQVWFNQLLGE